MHIIIGLLGTIVTLLILLNRLADAGIDLGGLNPFLWNRRRQWQKKYQGNPIYQLENPMEVTAILMVATAKCDGDISMEEKNMILQLFQETFKLTKRDAASLMIASAHLLEDGNALQYNLNKVLAPSLDKFSDSQIESALTLIKQVAIVGGESTDLQKEFYGRVETILLSASNSNSGWG